MSNLNIAVVGVGALGRHHARILSGMDGIELIGVADPNEDQGRSVAESCQTEWTADYRTLIDQCDAVSLVVPTFLHHKIASKLFEAGKSVLIEKPLTADTQQARELIELAKANNAVLQVGHVERFNPAYELAVEKIQQPRYIQAERLSPFSFRSTDIGVAHDLLIHDLELILNIVESPVKSVEANCWSVMSEKEDVIHARLTFENGCMASISASRINPEPKRTMQIWDVAGRIDLDMHARTVDTYSPSSQIRDGLSPVELASEQGADVAALRERVFGDFIEVQNLEGSDSDALTAELQNFVNAIRGDEAVRVDGHRALRALEVAEMILDSAQQNSWRSKAA